MLMPSNAPFREEIVDPEKLENEFVEIVIVDEFLPEDEKRLVKKLDRRIMSIASILYLFGCEYSIVHPALRTINETGIQS